MGGHRPGLYDCSGLTMKAWAAAGRPIPRTSQEQWRLLPRIDIKDMRPGDLIIYHADASHVAMYVGDGTIVHSPRPGRHVTLAGAGSMKILAVWSGRTSRGSPTFSPLLRNASSLPRRSLPRKPSVPRNVSGATWQGRARACAGGMFVMASPPPPPCPIPPDPCQDAAYDGAYDRGRSPCAIPFPRRRPLSSPSGESTTVVPPRPRGREGNPYRCPYPCPYRKQRDVPAAETSHGGDLTVLVIEDDPAGSITGPELSAAAGTRVRIRTARNLTEAGRLLTDDVDCILLDLALPVPAGSAGAAPAAAAPATASTTAAPGAEHRPEPAPGRADELAVLTHVLRIAPLHAVLVLTAQDDTELAAEAVRVGAQDYLFRGELDARVLSRAIRYAVERKRADIAQHQLTESGLRAQENARLERGLLPTPLLEGSDLSFAARYRPGRSRALLGGDFYDTVRTPDGTVHAMIGDVCGHGPDEAALGVELRIAWRALTLAGLCGDQLLSTLQQVLEHAAERGDLRDARHRRHRPRRAPRRTSAWPATPHRCWPATAGLHGCSRTRMAARRSGCCRAPGGRGAKASWAGVEPDDVHGRADRGPRRRGQQSAAGPGRHGRDGQQPAGAGADGRRPVGGRGRRGAGAERRRADGRRGGAAAGPRSGADTATGPGAPRAPAPYRPPGLLLLPRALSARRCTARRARHCWNRPGGLRRHRPRPP
ncbi:hypothetical protein SMICM304S_05690 [Streptomyces microflavus]